MIPLMEATAWILFLCTFWWLVRVERTLEIYREAVDQFQQQMLKKRQTMAPYYPAAWPRLARSSPRRRSPQPASEPTASLDAKQEYELFWRFNELTRGKTVILISQRLSSVRMVDRIFVIENGQLVEYGSQEELMSLGNRYAKLFNRQAEAYRYRRFWLCDAVHGGVPECRSCSIWQRMTPPDGGDLRAALAQRS